MKNIWIIGIVVILLIIGGYFLVKNKSGMINQIPATQTSIQPTASPANTASQSQNTITLSANGFSPANITIKSGQTITWINKSGQSATVNSDPHPMHTNYPPLNLGSFSDGGTLNLQFPTTGTYGYHNHFNPSQTGKIIVQ